MKLHSLTMFASLALASLAACGDDGASSGPDYQVVADMIPGGTLLSSATVGAETLFVGGMLDGSRGVLVRKGTDSLCYDTDISEKPLWWIHSSSDTEWWAVGEKGTILHSLDGVVTDESVESDAIFYGIYDQGERVVAVGGLLGNGEQPARGEVWLKQDDNWERLTDELPSVAFKVWENWIVGDGIAYQLDGDDLLPHPPPNEARLLTVVGRNTDDVYAVGGTATPLMLHWNGSDWQEIPVSAQCASGPLNGVWTAPGESVWIAGNFAAVAEYDGTEWKCPDQVISFEHFHSVSKHGEEFFWAGGNIFSPGENYGTIASFGEDKTALEPTACP